MDGVIFQCTQCRALVVASAVVADAADGTRAGLVCTVCRTTCWLPVAGARVDVTATVSPAFSALPPPRAHASASTPSIPRTQALPAEASSSAVAEAAVDEAVAAAPTVLPWTHEQRGRIEAALAQIPSTTEVHASLRSAFVALWPQWSQMGAHLGLLKRAALSDDLAVVGQCYRVVAGIVPDDVPTRTAQQELLRLAMATMSSSRELGTVEEPGTSGGVRTAALVGLVVLALVGTFLFSRMVNQLVASPQQQGGP